MQRIPVAGPSITEREIAYVTDAIRNGWYENAGEYPARFEAAFAAHCDRRHAFALPSCTSGLHLALAALGIGPGDEVIIPDITWIASSAPISYVGATPVFADIDPATWCLTPEALEACAGPRVKAAIVVDLYGSMPDWDGLRDAAQRRGIALIEDAAEAVGSVYRGRPAGSFGVASAFSFHGSKTVTTGEGGMLVANDPAFAERVATLRDHGRKPGDTMFRNGEVGFKYKMSALQAACGLAQIERLPELVEMKRAIFAGYVDALGDIDGLTLNAEPEGVRNSYWMVTAVFDADRKIRKDWLIPQLAAEGIDTRPFFHPLSMLPAYAGMPAAAAARERNRVAYDVSPRAVNLPSGLNMDGASIERTAAALRRCLARASTSR